MDFGKLKDIAMEATKVATNAMKEAATTAVNTIAETAGEAMKNITESAEEWNSERIRKNEAEKAEKAASEKREAEIASGCYMDNGKLVVSSTEGMQTWLQGLGKDTTPALMQTLQTQLQVLQTVQSASMTGMAMDNMILCLDKAIKMSSDETEKANIREAFASMLQNYYFFQEANVRCAAIKNQEESAELLKQAGSMLSKAVTKTAVAITQGNLDLNSIDIRNIFDSEEIRKGYINKLFSWFADKKMIKEKENEFYKTVENLFDTYDQYAELLGPSILSKGMLSRYRKDLVERRKEQTTEKYIQRNSKLDIKNLTNLSEGLVGIINGIAGPNKFNIASGATQSLAALAGLATDIINNQKKGLDIDSFCLLIDSLSREIEQLKTQLVVLEQDRETLTGKLAEAGMLQFALKKEIQSQIDEKKSEITAIRSALQPMQDKLSKMNTAFPDAKAIRDELVAYDARLQAIEEKFA